MIGAILAGVMSDLIGGSASICGAMILFAIPVIVRLENLVDGNVSVLIILLIILGLLLNGPYTLMRTAVSADLGTRPSLVKDKKALTTVTAIMDAFGSLGSAIGPLVTGLLISEGTGWDNVFDYLIAAQACALICLTRPIYNDLRRLIEIMKQKR